ncbi:DoxX family protein [Mariniluteicoccus flavus]
MRTLLHPPAALRDAALLVSRVLLGVVLMAHGWQKFAEWGLGGTAQSFGKMGVPAPQVSAVFSAVVELVGGALLILGAFTPAVAALVAINMLGAFLFAHAGKGVFVKDGGWELVAVIGAAAVALIGAGAGRFSVDGLLGRRTRPAEATTEAREARQGASAV